MNLAPGEVRTKRVAIEREIEEARTTIAELQRDLKELQDGCSHENNLYFSCPNCGKKFYSTIHRTND